MSTKLKWGLITGMVYIIFSLVSNMLGIQQGGGGNAGLGFLVNSILFLVTLYIIYLGVREIREEEYGGFLTFGQGFRTGLGIALIASIIAAVFTLIYMKFIDPNMGDKIMEGVEEQWEKSNMSEEQIEMSRKIMSYMFNPFFMTLFTICWVLFWGVIKSLIIGSILKKEAPPVVPAE